MARIGTFGIDQTISNEDKLIGTDAVDGSNKNFEVGSLSTFIKGTVTEITNQRTGTLTKLWFGTAAQLTSVVRDADTDYIITD